MSGQNNNSGNRPQNNNNQNRNGQKPGPNRNNRRRYRGNKNRTPNPTSQLERLVEKYINLLDQHLVARRKFHDLFYRADNNQLNKLERLFYQTINDLRDFEDKIAPEMKASFEQRINGLRPDTTYSTNHNINLEEFVPAVVPESEIFDPHLLQSQIKANFKGDTEESVGSIEDYNQYKNI